jgi:CSLREA domain-containing protein
VRQTIPLTRNAASRALTACVLTFNILITPVAGIAATYKKPEFKTQKSEVASESSAAKSAAADVFAKPLEDLAKHMVPAAEPAPAPLPAAPPVGSVTASLAATLAAGGGGIDADGDGFADPGDTIAYTLSLTNASGAGATGLAIANPLDSHTTIVPTSLNSTPVGFDQSVSLNEDATLVITLSGQDPDGSNLTFRDSAGSAFPANPTTIPTAHGTIGNFGSVSCDANGLCLQQVTYTPALNYNGSDSFSFKANDSTANSNENGVVSITVIAVNDAPTFTVPLSDPTAVNEDAGVQSVSNYITGLRPAQGPPTINSTEDTQTVTFEIVSVTHSALFTAGGQPTLNVSGAAYPKTATLTYTPAPNANGTAVVTYHLRDNGCPGSPGIPCPNGGVDVSADKTFTITVNAVNDLPVVDPVAKAFTAQANMKSVGFGGLLVNATDPDATNANSDTLSADKIAGYTAPTFSLASVTGACTSIVVNPATGAGPCKISNIQATGSFDFDPPPGVTGTVVLNYTITDTGNPAPAATSLAGTINVTVNGPVIWFVNPARTNNGNGTISNSPDAAGNPGPFNSLASATSAMGINASQRIFVFSGTTALNNAVPLAGGGTRPVAQWLIGQGVIATDFDTFFGITPVAATIPRPSVNGTRPTIRGLVTVKDNNTVQGLNVDVSGASAGTKGVSEGALNNAATSTILIKDVNVTSADGIAVDLGTGGTVTYETSNASTSPNSITSGTGTALRVVSTTIGANGMTFRSITAGTGSDSAGSGIILDTTGNTGSLTVSGNGSAGTGGTIQHKNGGDIHSLNADGTFSISGTTGVGIFLRSTKSPSFAWMALHDFSNLAVLGSSVTGLTMNQIITSGVNGSNPNVNEAVMHFDNLTTSASITNTTIAGGLSDNFSLINTSGSLNRIVFNTCTFGAMDSGNVNGDDSLFIQARNAATVNVTVQNSQMTSSRGDIFQVDLTDTATSDILFKSNVVNNQHPFVVVGGGGLTFSGGGSTGAAPTLTYDVGGANPADGNTFRGARGDALIVVMQTGHGSATGKIRNNTFGVQAVDKSGASEASDVDIRTVGRASQTVLISNNSMFQYANAGIQIQAGDNSVAGTTGTIGDVNATITNNTVSNFNTNVSTKAGIHVNLGTTAAPADTTILCADIQNNNAPNSGSTDVSAGSDFVVRQRQATTMRLPGYTGAATGATSVTDVTTYIKGRNTNGASSSVFVATPSAGSGYLNTSPAGSQCVQPVLPSGAMFKPEGSKQQLFALLERAAEKDSVSQTSPASLLALLSTTNDLGDVLNYAQPANTSTRDALDPVAESRPVLAAAQTEFVTLTPEAKIGDAEPAAARTTDSRNSASNFARAIVGMIEPTAHAEAAKASAADAGEASSRQYSEIRFGHASAGIRGQRLAARANHANRDVKGSNSEIASHNATAEPAMFTPAGSFPINGTGAGQGFTLPDGKTITITFKATLNAPPNFASYSATQKVTAQATLTGSFVGNPLLSDDPSLVGAADPTSTNVDLYDSTTTVVSSANPANTTQSVTFTATIGTGGTPNGSATNRTGTVVFKDSFNGGPVTPLTCPGGNQNVSSNQATCITSGLATGSHAITADYSGDGNFDPSSGSLTANLGQNGNPQIVSKSGTNATLTSSLNPATVTQNITFTFTIASATSIPGPPTGTVTFKDITTATNISCSNPGGQSLNGSGVATCQTNQLSAISHTIRADYPGDNNFNQNLDVPLTASAGQNGNPQVVSKATPTVTLVSDANPSFVSQTVTFTATVSAPASINAAPSGTLIFKDGAGGLGCTGGNQILSGGPPTAVATCTKNNLTAGSHTITVDFVTDSNFNAVSGTGLTAAAGQNGNPQVVNQSNTTMTVTNNSANNPSKVTESVTFKLNIKSSNGSISVPPTGQVKFWDGPAGGTQIGGTKTLGTSGCTDAQSACVLSDATTSLSAGTHTITVEYLGPDLNFTANSNNSLSQVVDKSDTSVNLMSSGLTPNVGDSVTFTATVSGSAVPPAIPFDDGGIIDFKDGSSTIGSCGGLTINASHQATCTTTALPAGSRNITAVYNGDPAFNGSTSNTVIQQVGPACASAPVVMNTNDNGNGSLRKAIADACVGATITFDATVFDVPGAPHFIDLIDVGSPVIGGELAINKDLIITGPGSNVLTVRRALAASTKFRVFNISAGTVTLSGMTISNGSQGATAQAPGSPGASGTAVNGGGIFNASTLNLQSVIVSGNSITGGDGGNGAGAGDAGGAGGAAYGGGIFNSGTLTLTNSTVNGSNSATGGKGGSSDTTPGAGGGAFGGGVYNTFSLTLTNSTIGSNSATGGAGGANTGVGAAGSTGNGLGGGIYNDGDASAATATITNTTIGNNIAGTGGGGVYNFGATSVGTLSIAGSTINGNSAPNGAGIYNSGPGINAPASIINSTISGNLASNTGGGLYNDSGTSAVTLTSVTITGNFADNDSDTNGNGGGIHTVSTNLTLKNTTVAGNLKGAVKQIETLTVAVTGSGTLSTGGNASITISGDSFNGGVPQPYSIPVTALQDASAVATDIKTELENGTHPEVTNFFDIVVIGANVRFTVKTPADNDPNLNISIDSCTCQSSTNQPGLVVPANSANTKAGVAPPAVKQVETLTVAVTGGGTLSTGGNASITIFGDTFNGGVSKNYSVPVGAVDANGVAQAIKTELENGTHPEVTSFFDPLVVTVDKVEFTVTTAAADDVNLNISIDSCTCVAGLDAANSANTTPGSVPVNQQETLTVAVGGGGTLSTGGNASVTIAGDSFNVGVPVTYMVPVTAGQNANAVALAIKTELENAHPEVTGFFDPLLVTGANVKFTKTTAEVNDVNLNISIDSCTCQSSTSQAGLSPANSANTSPGGTASPNDISGTVDGGSSFNLIGNAATSGGLVDRSTDVPHQNQVGSGGSGTVDINTVLFTALANNGGPTQTHKLKNPGPAIDQGFKFSLTTDQRGFQRFVDLAVANAVGGDGSDIGAFEDQGPTQQPVLTLTSTNSSGTTRDSTPDFGATMLVIGATVEFKRGATTLSTVTASSATMSFTDNTLTTDGGPFSYTVTQTVAGSPATSDPVSVTVNTKPSVPDLDVGSDSVGPVGTGGTNADNVTKVTTPTFTGGAPTDPTTTIRLYANGATLLGSTTSDGSGVWTITSSPLGAGDYTITAREVFGAFEGADGPGLSVTIDLSVATPSTPVLLSPDDDTGTLGDSKTKLPTPRLTGTANANCFIQFFANGSPAGSGVSDGTGAWTIATTALSDGTYAMTAVATDAANNVSPASGPLSLTIDSQVAAPSTPDLITADDSGTFTNDNYTNKNKPTFSGTAEVGSTVKVFADNVEVGSGTATGGSWNIIACVQPACTALADGSYSITATATDTAGNTSSASSGVSVTIDTQAPAKPTLPPDLVAADDTGASSTDNVTKTTKPTLNGANTTVEASTIVDLFADNGLGGGPVGVGTGSADGAGAWSILACTLPGCNVFADGTYLFTVKATDLAGNQSVASDPLQVVIDTVQPSAPSTPVLNPADDTGISPSDKITKVNTPNFTGEAEADSTVQLFAGVTPVGSGLANGVPGSPGNKAWTIISGLLPDNSYSMTARATDVAGNTSGPSGAFGPLVIDTVKPTVTMSSAVGNPTATTPIPVDVHFSETVFGFTLAGIVPGPPPPPSPPPPGATAGSFAGSGQDYTFNLTPGSPGGVFADIPADGATDTAGNGNTAAVQFNRTFDPSALNATITAISPNPRNTAVSSIQIVFNKPVTGFDLTNLKLTRDGGATNLLTVAQTLNSADNATWTLGNLAGITAAEGTYDLTLTAASSGIQDSTATALASDATTSWGMDTTKPTVTVEQAAGQTDPFTGPTGTTIINFTATFNEPVTGLTPSGVTLLGGANPTIVNVTGSGKIYNLAVQGMNQTGTVRASINLDAAQDSAGNGNAVSTSADNTVQFNADNFSTLEVNTTADPGDGVCDPIGTGDGCTLREAILAANADFGADTITFNIPNTDPGFVGGVYTISLLSALPDITSDMTITGLGAKVLTVERNSGAATRFRIFTITGSPTVNISGLTITKGFTADGFSNGISGLNGDTGGGINNAGTLTLTGVAVTNNQTGKGGNGTVGPGAGGSGGGVVNLGGTLNLVNTTVSGNQAGNGGNTGPGQIPGGAGSGGGVHNAGTMTVTNSTISGNQTGVYGTGGLPGSPGAGGGINNAAGTLTVSNSTITANNAGGGGGIRVSGGVVTLKSSIVAGNTATVAPDIENTVNSEGFNLIQSTSGATIN